MSNFCKSLLAASLLLAGLLLLHLWPFSRTALLIPLAWWSMFVVNRWRVSMPVLGLIDEVAERSGYWPVYPKKQRKQESRPVENKELTRDPGLDSPEPSVA